MNEEILAYYKENDEHNRLSGCSLERIRTQELLLRFITKPQRILDLGGGTGVYSFWLSELGHEVHLLDASPKHIELAEKINLVHHHKLQSIILGDARNLKLKENFFDAVLNFGPLYHLTHHDDRIQVLTEAKKVLKDGGTMFNVAITRYASLVNGFKDNLIQDSHFIPIMLQDLENGQHRNVEDKNYFTTSFFHTPFELESEIREANLYLEGLFAVESFGRIIPDLKIKLEDKTFREVLLRTIRKVEQEPSILGISHHIMGIAKKI